MEEMKKESNYSLSFSAGALLSEAFQAVLTDCSDYNALSEGKYKPEYSIIPVNSENSQKRYLSEVLKRLSNVHPSILSIYLSVDDEGKRLIEFFSICNTYRIIQEFMFEVVRNKWLNLDFELDAYDFKSFLLHKLSETDSIEQVSESTGDKLAQVALKILKELGMYNGKEFRKADYERHVVKTIYSCNKEWFLDAILLTEEEKKEVKEW